MPDDGLNMGEQLARLFMKKEERDEVAFGFTRPVPTISEFITDSDFLGQQPLSKRQAHALDAVLGKDPLEVFRDRTLPNEAVMAWGKGSGKDLVSSYLIAFLAYLICCMENPQAQFGLANDEPLDIINVAANANQAKEVFFAKLGARLKRPCFAEFKPKITKQLITFPTKNLKLHSLHSANESWEGMNVLAWVMDEASGFRTTGGADNAEAVYNTLVTSSQSRFLMHHWIGIIISFPRKQQGDFTLTKYERAKDNPRMFADRAATWEVHPMYEEGHPLYREDMEWVTIEELNISVPLPLKDHFDREGADAMTKYAAKPPPTESGFFEFPAAITEAVKKNVPLTERLITMPGEREEFNEETGQRRRYVSHVIGQIPPVAPGASYFMHGDPGLSSDAFALSLAHTTPETKTIVEADGKQREIQRIVVDFVLTWEPRSNRPVDLLNVDQTILMLAQTYRVKKVTFDRWNSAQSIQALVSHGFDAEDMAFSAAQQLAMYRYLKILLYNQMIDLPEDEPLQNELKFLRIHNGKLEHDIYGKDRADAVAAVCWSASGRHQSNVRKLVMETIEGTTTHQQPTFVIVNNKLVGSN